MFDLDPCLGSVRFFLNTGLYYVFALLLLTFSEMPYNDLFVDYSRNVEDVDLSPNDRSTDILALGIVSVYVVGNSMEVIY